MKRLALPRVGGFLLPGCELEHKFFQPLDLNWNTSLLLLDFETADLGTRTYTIGSAGSQAVRLRLELHRQQSWISSLLTIAQSISRAFLCNHLSHLLLVLFP